MKNLIKLFALAMVLIFTSCAETENLQIDLGVGFVQLASKTASTTENNAEPIAITVVYGGSLASNTNGINVNYTLSSANAARYTVSPANGTVTIPAGEATATISITPVDNFDVDGNEVITLALAASDKPVGIGGQGVNNASATITIIDNDCPININDFVGTYTVFENFTAGTNSPSGLNNFFGEAYQMEITLDPNDITGTKVILNNSAGFNEYIADGTVMSFDTCNNKIVFDAGFPTVALFRTFAYDNSSYDEDKKIIQCTGPLATFGAYQFTFTKQ